MAAKKESKSVEAGRGHVVLTCDTTALEKGLADARKAIAAFGRKLAAMEPKKPKKKPYRKPFVK